MTAQRSSPDQTEPGLRVEWLTAKGCQPLAFVRPDRELDAGQDDRLQSARAALVDGGPRPRDRAEAIINSLQRELGISPEDHTRALRAEGGAIAAKLMTGQMVRASQYRRMVKNLPHPDRQPAPTAALVRMLRDLDAIEHQGRLARTAVDQSKKARNGRATATVRAHARRCEERARKLRIEIDAERQKQLATVWAANAVSESEALAEIRGEQVSRIETEVSDWERDAHGGMVRFRGQPRLKTERARTPRILRGLALAFERGALDGAPASGDRLYEVGKRYGRSFERANSLRTPDPNAVKVDHSKPEPERSIAAEAIDDLTSMRSGLDGEQEIVLDLICGLDHTITQTAAIMGGRKSTAEERLRMGLYRAGEGLLWW